LYKSVNPGIFLQDCFGTTMQMQNSFVINSFVIRWWNTGLLRALAKTMKTKRRCGLPRAPPSQRRRWAMTIWRMSL